MKQIQIFPIILVGIFSIMLRFHHLDFESLFMDEIHQVSYYPHSLFQIIRDAAVTAQPPLDYWIGHVVQLISDSDAAYRVPAALFGTGNVLIVTILISRICSPTIGFGAGLVMSMMPFHIYYSQEARPYAISMFFFCCMIWSLDSLLKSQRLGLLKFLWFLLLSTTFLYSRSFSPLIVMLVLLMILFFRWGIGISRRNPLTSPLFDSASVIAAMIAITGALLMYYPSFQYIAAKNQRYLTSESTGLISGLFRSICQLNIRPLWESYAAQTEPLTYPLILLAVISPYDIWKSKLWEKDTIIIHSIILLPAAGFAQVVIFQAKSDLPFRPPYAEYILSLVILLSASGCCGMYHLLGCSRLSKMYKPIFTLILLVMIANTAYSAWSFKQIQKKEDWRGVSQYVTDSFDSRHLLIFDSLSLYGHWEPTFYGFPRYYKGSSRLISMAQIPFAAEKLKDIHLEPVMILHQWRQFFLTPRSQYPVMPVPQGYVDINLEGLLHDSSLNIKVFTGFFIIRLKDYSGRLIPDALRLMKRLLLYVPDNSQASEIHLALASLYRITGQGAWEDHIRKAKAAVTESYLPKLLDAALVVESMDAAEIMDTY